MRLQAAPAAWVPGLVLGDDDYFVERLDRGELVDFDHAAGRREKVCAIEHKRADAENRDCDEGADHSMNPEFPAVHKPVLISGRRYHFDPAHPEKVGPGSHIRGPGVQKPHHQDLVDVFALAGPATGSPLHALLLESRLAVKGEASARLSPGHFLRAE